MAKRSTSSSKKPARTRKPKRLAVTAATTKKYQIHPAIGFARVGNSPESYPAPTIPGVITPPESYRDSSPQKRLKRQAATFWVYEYDLANPEAAPVLVKAGADQEVVGIEWTVHLANRKAAWFEFDGLVGAKDILNPPLFGYPANSLRNPQPPLSNPEGRRKKWVIDPGPRTLDVPGSAHFSKGTGGGYPETWPAPFLHGNAPGIETLGQMELHGDFSLTVLGGFGHAGSIGQASLPSYANNPDWFDDTSDGSVQARVVLADGVKIDASPAWVIVGPPDFAPPIENIVTMYDVLFDVGLRFQGLDPSIFDPVAKQFTAGFKPSFEQHIFPILWRAARYRWVYDNNSVPEPPSYHTSLDNIAALSKPPVGGSDPNLNKRRAIFKRLRNPNPDQTNNVPGNMPALHSDLGDGPDGALKFTLTITQFEMMRRWAEGEFTRGTGPLPPPPPTKVTAAGLDRAALEAAVGGAFFPGIEAGWIMREPNLYVTPFEFRFKHAVNENDTTGLWPGDVTKRSALPWQADFVDCSDNWWPAQRPNEVRASAASEDYAEWDDGVSGSNRHLKMVEKWSQLGVVVREVDENNAEVYVESERTLPRP